LDATLNTEKTNFYSPFQGWTPRDIAAMPGGGLHVLWTLQPVVYQRYWEELSVWEVDANLFTTGYRQFGTIYSGWQIPKTEAEASPIELVEGRKSKV
jgi:hypothetical protein